MENKIETKIYKQFIFIIGLILFIVVLFIVMAKNQNLVVVENGNIGKIPYKVEVGKYQDSDCGMAINDLNFVSQVVSNDGKTWFFHDHGGMANWLKTKSFKDEVTIFVMSLDSKQYIDGKKAWYSRTDTTPMGYGFGAYEYKQDNFISFDEMFLHMARGEHLQNPQIKSALLRGEK